MYDLAVIGLGAMGAATAWHATRFGLAVIGLDRHEPPHTLGSSHAETRITRLAVGEGTQYLPFVRRSHELWRQLGERTGEHVLHCGGGYIVTEAAEAAARWTDFTAATAAVAARAGLTYERFDGTELEARQPQLRVPAAASVGFEPTAGIVMCERAIELQLGLARTGGAAVRTGAAGHVIGVEPRGDHVVVSTASSRVEARRVVLAAGPWLPSLVPVDLGQHLSVTRQVVHWFEADDPDEFSVDRFPFVMWIREAIDDYFAVFPMPPGSAVAGVKVLGEQFGAFTTPDDVDRTVRPSESADFHERLLRDALPGLSDRCVKSEVCLYTNTPDDHFFIGSDPRSDRITIMSPCSGHGFKHSTALGEAVAQHAHSGSSDLDLSPFALLR